MNRETALVENLRQSQRMTAVLHAHTSDESLLICYVCGAYHDLEKHSFSRTYIYDKITSRNFNRLHCQGQLQPKDSIGALYVHALQKHLHREQLLWVFGEPASVRSVVAHRFVLRQPDPGVHLIIL